MKKTLISVLLAAGLLVGACGTTPPQSAPAVTTSSSATTTTASSPAAAAPPSLAASTPVSVDIPKIGAHSSLVQLGLNADQTIPHFDRLRINAPATAPVWISEETTKSRDVSVALQLAQRHLPIVASLPAPVLYSASDQISGHIGDQGFARGPVSVTVGGCTKHDPLVYRPIPAEQALINAYETCGPGAKK